MSRLCDSGAIEVVTDPAAAELIIVSTRLPRIELRRALTSLTRNADAPVVALVHTGGEGSGVEALRAGAAGMVAEGNEAAATAYVTGSVHDQSMLDTFERQIAGQRQEGARSRDRVTTLPTSSAFEARIDDLVQGGQIPRVALLRVLHLAEVAEGLSREAAALLRRRLAVTLRELTHRHGGELYAIDDTEFGLIAETLSTHRTNELGQRMARVTETFSPLGHQPLGLAMGHVGPEAALEVAPLASLARRALDAAAAEKRSAVVSAEQLALGVSSTTELEAAQRAVAFVERHDVFRPGHGARVARWSAEIARHLGVEGQVRSRIQLAGLLHDIGKVTLTAQALAAPHDLDAGARAAYESHPTRGAGWLRASCGDDVADAVAAHQERWDGAGYPLGLANDAIPLGARIIRVADTLDALLSGADDPTDGPLGALDALAARAGSELDPDIVEATRPALIKLLTDGES